MVTVFELRAFRDDRLESWLQSSTQLIFVISHGVGAPPLCVGKKFQDLSQDFEYSRNSVLLIIAVSIFIGPP